MYAIPAVAKKRQESKSLEKNPNIGTWVCSHVSTLLHLLNLARLALIKNNTRHPYSVFFILIFLLFCSIDNNN